MLIIIPNQTEKCLHNTPLPVDYLQVCCCAIMANCGPENTHYTLSKFCTVWKIEVLGRITATLLLISRIYRGLPQAIQKLGLEGSHRCSIQLITQWAAKENLARDIESENLHHNCMSTYIALTSMCSKNLQQRHHWIYALGKLWYIVFHRVLLLPQLWISHSSQCSERHICRSCHSFGNRAQDAGLQQKTSS